MDNASKCFKCAPSNYKVIEEECKSTTECSDPNGLWYSIDTRLCMKCRPECECTSLSPCSKCKTGSNGFMKHDMCQTCLGGCTTCEGDVKKCTSCSGANFLQDGLCVAECSSMSHYDLGGGTNVCA